MSTTANWSYTNDATVWPIESQDNGWGGSGDSYGEPYVIKCTWAGGGETMTGSDGQQFVPSYRFWHEDKRVKFGDWIARGVEIDRLKGDPIKAHTEYDMSFFEEQSDYMSVT